MNTTGLDLHLRGRDVIECEVFERTGTQTLVLIKKGYLSRTSSDDVAVIVLPTAKSTFHRFPMIDALGDGYAYEGDPNGPRGWRVRIDQIRKP